MLSKTLIILSSFLAAVLAIQVDSPAKDAQLDLSKTNEITWSSVSTDPATFEIVLVDQSTMTSHVIAQSVSTAAGKYSFSNLAVASGSRYRINFISNTPNNSGILAQSQEFSIKTGSDTESSNSMTSVSTSTGSGMSSAATATASSASSSTTATTGSLTSIPASASKSTASTTTSAASASGSTTSKTPSASTGNSIRAVVSTTLAGIGLVLVTLLF